MQIPCAHILLLYYTVIHPSILANTVNTCQNTYFSQCNLVSRLYALRSVRNFHHWKGLLLVSQFQYKLEMVWIRGSEVIGCQSPKILNPDLAEPRDSPRPPIWDYFRSASISSKYSDPPHRPPRAPYGHGLYISRRTSATGSLLLWTLFE